MKTVTNREVFERALQVFPGGVNSPVRAFGAVGGVPRVIASADGAHVTDVEGRRYLDYVASWGAVILGHAAPEIVEAVQRAASRGTSYGAPTPGEVELAELITAGVPSIERLRFTSSGTEAAMSALRLARAYTGREKIVKFSGCYHGHADMLLVAAGSGVATLGIPGSAGVPQAATQHTLAAPYNDPDAVASLFGAFPDEIAAVIVEPVAANMGLVPPAPGFLPALRDLTARHGALLIFDEVITGFRLGWGGAQGRYGVRPDLTILGKVIGGGLPVGAYGGRAEIMDRVAPIGPMYQAGTLSGNPLAMAAGIAAVRRLRDAGTYETLEARGRRLAEGLEAAGAPAVTQVGSMLTAFFLPAAPRDYAEAGRADTARFARFFHAMLERGILLPPSQFEAWFLTLAHTDEEIDRTVEAAREALRD